MSLLLKPTPNQSPRVSCSHLECEEHTVSETLTRWCLAQCGCDRLWEGLLLGGDLWQGLRPGRRSTIGGFTVPPSGGGNAPPPSQPQGRALCEARVESRAARTGLAGGWQSGPAPPLALWGGWQARGPIVADGPAPLIVQEFWNILAAAVDSRAGAGGGKAHPGGPSLPHALCTVHRHREGDCPPWRPWSPLRATGHPSSKPASETERQAFSHLPHAAGVSDPLASAGLSPGAE